MRPYRRAGPRPAALTSLPARCGSQSRGPIEANRNDNRSVILTRIFPSKLKINKGQLVVFPEQRDRPQQHAFKKGSGPKRKREGDEVISRFGLPKLHHE